MKQGVNGGAGEVGWRRCSLFEIWFSPIVTLTYQTIPEVEFPYSQSKCKISTFHREFQPAFPLHYSVGIVCMYVSDVVFSTYAHR
jgi:Gpi18-like mannosyltransferase